MKLSVVTPTYNSEATVAQTLESVARQSHSDVEHIIVDGGSADATLDIVRRFEPRARWRSERDRGIYDAMNKGIAEARGDVVGILCSDDYYAHDRVLSEVAARFEDPTVECVYGDLVYVDARTDKVLRVWSSRRVSQTSFRWGAFPPHPAFFARRSVYERFGGFDLKFKIAADFELMLRMLCKHRLRSAYVADVLVRMRAGGTSNGSLSAIAAGVEECRRAFAANGVRAPLLFVPGTLAFRFEQRLRALVGSVT